MHPGTLLSTLLPRLYFPDAGMSTVTRPAFEPDVPWLLCLYVGPFVIGMALLAFSSRLRRAETYLGLGLLGSFTILSLGRHVAGVGSLLELQAFQSAFRVPQKFFFGSFIVLVLLGTSGFARFVAMRVRPRIAIAVLGLVTIVPPIWLALASRTTEGLGGLLTGTVGIAAGYLLLSGLHLFSKHRRGWVVASLVALVALDLWLVNQRVNPTLPSPTDENIAPTVQFLSNQEPLFRVQTGAQIIGDEETHGIPNALPPAERAALYREGIAPNINMDAGIPTFYGFEPMKAYKTAFFLNRLEKAPDLETRERLMGLVNIRYVLSMAPLDSPSFVDVAVDGRWRIYETTSWLPRAFARGRIRHIDNRQFPQEMFGGALDPERVVLVPDDHTENRVLSELDSPGEVEIVSYRSSEVRLTARMEEPGLVVLLDVDYPGWEASVDGSATRILPAFGLFRGVEVGSGTHDVVFRYRERRFRAGLLMSLFGVLMCGVTLLLPWGPGDPSRR
jgi:hypothetical protein